jgi:hypothetical protein
MYKSSLNYKFSSFSLLKIPTTPHHHLYIYFHNISHNLTHVRHLTTSHASIEHTGVYIVMIFLSKKEKKKKRERKWLGKKYQPRTKYPGKIPINTIWCRWYLRFIKVECVNKEHQVYVNKPSRLLHLLHINYLGLL